MNEVSCKATQIILDAVESTGVDLASLVAGLPVSLARLRDPSQRVDWDVFVDLSDRIEARAPVTLEEIGLRTNEVHSFGFMRAIGAAVLDPRQLYRAGARWFGPAMYPHLRCTFEEPTRQCAVMTLEIPEPFRPCASYLRLVRGVVTGTPRLLGLPLQRVSAEITPRLAIYTIQMPPPLRTTSRLRGLSRLLVGGRVLTEELARQQAELTTSYQAVLQSREDFRQIIERIPDGVGIHRNGVFVWVNPAMLRWMGYESPRELIGRRVLDVVHPDDRAMVGGRIAIPVEQSEHLPSVEFRVLRRDGGVAVGEFAPAQAVNYEGEPARLVIARDVTERRRMQEQLLVADRLAALGTLSASVAHEINNPLAYVHANLDAAARELERLRSSASEPRVARVRESIAAAREGTDRVRGIVRELKTFSRGGDESPGPVDVWTVLDSTLALASREVSRRAKLELDRGPVPPASTSPARLGQVFLNLVLNAVEAIPDGDPAGNTVRVRTLTDEAGRAVIEVSDTGVGIPPEILQRIFDPFFTTKPVGTGTGLGLSICRQLIARSGGEITVTSTPHVGTTFRVVIPADTRAATRPAPPAPPATTARAPRGRVLVVDDEALLVRILSNILSEFHDVTTAASGREAMELLRANDFDAVLCDLMMADMTGMDVYDSLARERPGMEARLIFMTGGAFTPRAQKFLESVPNRCLEKPLDANELLAAVATRVGG